MKKGHQLYTNNRRTLMLGICFALLFAILGSGCEGCIDEHKSEGQYFVPAEYEKWEPMRVPLIEGPRSVSFGEVERGELRTQKIQIKNTGRAPLDVSEWVLSDPQRFRLKIGGVASLDARRLEAKSFVDLEITYRAATTERAQETLTIHSNAHNEPIFTINLNANVRTPCLTIEPEELDFGIGELDQTKEGTFRVKSCSDNAITTFKLSPLEGSSEFALRTPVNREYELGPNGEETTIKVAFTPKAPGTFQAQFAVETNEEEDNFYTLVVKGKGAPYECPQAVISASIGNETNVDVSSSETIYTIPLETVQLSAKKSFSGDDFEIQRYEWTLINRPTDSAAALGQSKEDLNNSLWLDLSGDYVVELNVWDELGAKSCSSTRVTIKAIPNEDIHVQLVWDTPNDSDQLDATGSDVDLHLKHPNGRWDFEPWDCFWQNIEPDWGRIGDSSDDPSLDIDDVDGWGPENINLNNPENNTEYDVGIHYFSDHGFGSSWATVRIYIGGQPVFEQKRKRMRDQEFWYVAKVVWPSGKILVVDELSRFIP